MFDPFSGSVFVRGEVIKIDTSSLKIVFRKSSAFWDESDIANIGEQIELSNVENTNIFNLGDKVIGYGQVERKGTLDTIRVYPSYFQPFGIDWKVTFWVLFLLILGLATYKIFIKKSRKARINRV